MDTDSKDFLVCVLGPLTFAFTLVFILMKRWRPCSRCTSTNITIPGQPLPIRCTDHQHLRRPPSHNSDNNNNPRPQREYELPVTECIECTICLEGFDGRGGDASMALSLDPFALFIAYILPDLFRFVIYLCIIFLFEHFCPDQREELPTSATDDPHDLEAGTIRSTSLETRAGEQTSTEKKLSNAAAVELTTEKLEEIANSCVECVICISGLDDGRSCRILPECGHQFHVVCVDPWLMERGTCPLCRRLCSKFSLFASKYL
ncbi:hypothetical protein Ancab_007291 [Ancistrocladus abbreviatus]